MAGYVAYLRATSTANLVGALLFDLLVLPLLLAVPLKVVGLDSPHIEVWLALAGLWWAVLSVFVVRVVVRRSSDVTEQRPPMLFRTWWR